MSGIVREFPYRPQWKHLALIIISFSIIAVALEFMAVSNHRGLTLIGEEALSPGEATEFYWAMCAACVAMAMVGVLGIFRIFILRQSVVLYPAEIHVPVSQWSARRVIIPYEVITKLQLNKSSVQQMVTIICSTGRFTIFASCLKTRADFDVIFDALCAGVDQSNRE